MSCAYRPNSDDLPDYYAEKLAQPACFALLPLVSLLVLCAAEQQVAESRLMAR